jgi:predicted nucleic acid-binding protein
MILELALEANADLLVSGDIHLLETTPFRGIPIVTLAQAQERLRMEPHQKEDRDRG